MQCFCWLRCWIILILATALEPLLAQSGQNASEESHSGCINNLRELEQSLLNKTVNMEALTNAFFPPNQPLPLVVQVCYYVLPNMVNSADDQSDCGNFSYMFRWTKSQVHFFITPGLLQSLSLYVIRTHTSTVKILLDPLCDVNETTGHISEDYSVYRTPQGLLTQLTISLKSYALLRESVITDGVDYTINGYVLIFNKSQRNYVVREDENTGAESNEVLLEISLALLELLVTVTVTGIVYAYYDRIIDNYRKIRHLRAIFFIHAFILSELLCSVAFVCYFLLDVIGNQLLLGTATALRINYYFMGLLGFLFLLDVTVTILVGKIKFKNEVDIQIFCHRDFLGCSVILQMIAMLSTLTAAQALSFHAIFLCLSFIIAPTEACATILLYVTILFSLMSAMASMLIVIDQRKNIVGSKLKFACAKIAIGVLVCFILVFVIVFGYSFLKLTIYAGDYETGGLTSLIAGLIPTAILAGLTWFSKKMFSSSQYKYEDSDGNISDVDRNQNMTAMENVKNLPIESKFLVLES